jgi:hypothetical protein
LTPTGRLREPTQRRDWAEAWVERFFVLNTLIADSVFGVIAVAVVTAAERGVRELSATAGKCPEFGHLEFADLLHYLSFGLIGVIVCRFAIGLVVQLVISPIVRWWKG